MSVFVDYHALDLLFYFDSNVSVSFWITKGAPNVQKAGRLTAATYPWISVSRGVEHLIANFFKKVAKTWKIRYLLNCVQAIYIALGSGSCHQPFALFKKYVQKFNNGKFINLLKGTEIRFGSLFYAMQRAIKLQEPLTSTVQSPEFKDYLKLPKNKHLKVVSDIVLDQSFWDAAFHLCKLLHPAMRILRMADSNRPNMDKLLYCMNKMEESLLSEGPGIDAFEWWNRVPEEPENKRK